MWTLFGHCKDYGCMSGSSCWSRKKCKAGNSPCSVNASDKKMKQRLGVPFCQGAFLVANFEAPPLLWLQRPGTEPSPARTTAGQHGRPRTLSRVEERLKSLGDVSSCNWHGFLQFELMLHTATLSPTGQAPVLLHISEFRPS